MTTDQKLLDAARRVVRLWRKLDDGAAPDYEEAWYHFSDELDWLAQAVNEAEEEGHET